MASLILDSSKRNRMQKKNQVLHKFSDRLSLAAITLSNSEFCL
jgi:hypothetical protein